MKVLGVLFVLLLLVISPLSALDPGETQALNDMLSEWNASLGKVWLGQPNCSWVGLSCSNDGHVVNITLQNMGLSGIIPPSNIQLLWLKNLDLSSSPSSDINQLMGSIPSFPLGLESV